MDLIYSGGGNPRADISAMIRQIEAAGGGTLTIIGEHVVDGTIDEVATNLTVAFGPTGKLILGAGLSVPVLSLRPPVPYTGTLRLFSPRIDCSHGKYIGGQLSSSAICPSLYARLEVFDCDLYAGDWRDNAGDSGISPLGVVSGLIEGGRIEGFSDLGIYVTGGLIPSPHAEEMLIRSLTIKDCRQGIDSKRGYGQVTARNIKVIGCEVPYRMSWVGNESSGGGPLPPGIRMDVINGEIRNPKIAFQPEGPAILKVDGTTITSARSLLARNQGATLKGKCDVPAGSTKVAEENLTAGGTTYKPTTNLKVIP
jgi:hypothetical protein